AGLAAFDALKAKADDKPIYVFGASIGSAVALHVAANRDVRGLVLHNPPPLRQIILRNYGWWNLWLLAGPVALQIPRDLDSIACGANGHLARCVPFFAGSPNSLATSSGSLMFCHIL